MVINKTDGKCIVCKNKIDFSEGACVLEEGLKCMACDSNTLFAENVDYREVLVYIKENSNDQEAIRASSEVLEKYNR